MYSGSDYVLVNIAKRIAKGETQQTDGFKKSAFYSLMKRRAAEIREGSETSEQAFARFVHKMAEGRELYGAYHLAKPDDDAPVEKTAPAQIATSASYDKLMAKGAELRKADPKLTEAQAFAKAYEDPANKELVAHDRQWQVERSVGRR